MAPVNFEGRSRGQLILIGGLSLAIILVALALILNTAIFTENLASRNDDAIAGQAVGFQQSTTGEVAAAMAQVNQKSNTTACTGSGPKFVFVEQTVVGVREAGSQYGARDGVAATFDFATDSPGTDITCGTRIYQDSFDTFEDDDGTDTWGVADPIENPSGETPKIREFEMTVDRDQLLNVDVNPSSDAFRVRLAASNTWRVFVYYDSVAMETIVEVDGPTSGTCVDSTGSQTTIDVTGATVGGDRCQYLEDMWADLKSDGTDIDMDFVFGQRVDDGTFSVLVGQTVADDSRFDDSGGVENQKIVYSTAVDIGYRTAGVTYEVQDFRIAPGEYDD